MNPYFRVENLYTVTSCSGVDGVTRADARPALRTDVTTRQREPTVDRQRQAARRS
jgi:hypothetical protein